MAKRKLFLYLASAAGYVGIGMLLGYAFSDQATDAALWVGALLVLFGAILLGMFISSRNVLTDRQDETSATQDETITDSRRRA